MFYLRLRISNTEIVSICVISAHIPKYQISILETPLPIQNSCIQCWIYSSVPSPSPHDNVILHDRDNKPIRKIQVRGYKQKIEYETVQKRFYVETNDIIHENWKISHHELIYHHYLSCGKTVPLIGTFNRYRHIILFNINI